MSKSYKIVMRGMIDSWGAIIDYLVLQPNPDCYMHRRKMN
jgi:hypothetical protein